MQRYQLIDTTTGEVLRELRHFAPRAHNEWDRKRQPRRAVSTRRRTTYNTWAMTKGSRKLPHLANLPQNDFMVFLTGFALLAAFFFTYTMASFL